jgi:hypothetical protein
MFSYLAPGFKKGKVYCVQSTRIGRIDFGVTLMLRFGEGEEGLDSVVVAVVSPY